MRCLQCMSAAQYDKPLFTSFDVSQLLEEQADHIRCQDERRA